MRGPESLLGRAGAFERDWTKGSITRNLFGLAWPIIVTFSLYSVSSIIDMIWVGKLGIVPLAGVGVVYLVVFLVLSANMGFVVGARAIIARLIGAGDTEGANHAARQALLIVGVYSVTIAALCVIFAEPILGLFKLKADVVGEAAAFMRIYALTLVPFCFWMLMEGIMLASGDAVTPLKIAFVSKLIHAALCPSWIFGWWLFPELGLNGAAVANVISQSLGMLLALWSLFSGWTRLRLTWRNLDLDFNMMQRIIKIGTPALVMNLQMSLGSSVLMRLVAPFGTLAVAAHSLGLRIEEIIFMPLFGLGMASGVLVGQNLGARQPERAESTGWQAVAMAQAFMVAFSLGILLKVESVIRIFNPDPSLVELASAFLRIATIGYLVMAFSVVFQNCISGAGDTLPPMVFSLVVLWLIQLPLASLLPQVGNLGVYGVRWAIVAGILVGAATYTTYYRLGRWKRKQL